VETIRKVRLAARDGDKSIRRIARDLNLSRNTVRKVLRSDETEFKYERSIVNRPQLGPHVSQLEHWLEADQGLPSKRRRSAQVLYEALQETGYRGGYDTVRRYVKAWRVEHQEVKEAYIPLNFDAGDAFQFDWSHETIVLGGQTTAIKLAHIRLSHSRLFLVVAYMRESQEMVFDAHRRAFEFFGGVCRRGVYDNMKTAITTILRGKERDFNRRFTQLCSHYRYEPVACTPGSGWEKGQVEHQVKLVRRRFFTPRRRAQTLAALNESLQGECLAWAQSHRHPELKDKTIWKVFEAERSALISLPPPFDGYAERIVRVSSTSLVSFDRNRYSVDCRAVGQVVQLRSYADRIVVLHDGQVIGEHGRQFGRDRMIFDAWHYLPVLKRKPGALRNGAPFKDWHLPRALQRVRQRMRQYADGDRQFVDVLACVPAYGLEAVARACDAALLSDAVSRDVILNLLSRDHEQPDEEAMDIPAHLQLVDPPISNCGRYDRFRKEVSHVTG